MSVLIIILICLLGGPGAYGQIKDRYLEITYDTLSRQELDTNFLRSTFSSSPSALFINKEDLETSQGWGIQQWGDRIEFKAVKGNNFFTPVFHETQCDKTFRAQTDRELYTLLGDLFHRAILLAEETEGIYWGSEGNIYYFMSTDPDGKLKTAMKWVPDTGSLCRELTDLGDSIYSRIVRNESDWEPIKQTASTLLNKLKKEPLPSSRYPVYQGKWPLGLQMTDSAALSEAPRFPTDVNNYFNEYMNYPHEMLATNRGGYAVCRFTLDTFGLPNQIITLESSESACEKEVKRLIRKMPHWLPARNPAGKRVECMYTVYVPFRPQRYFTKLKKEALWEKQKELLFVEYDHPPVFPGGDSACIHFIEAHTQYPPSYIGSGKNIRITGSFVLNSYGEPTEFEIVRGSGIPEFDQEALRVLRLLPRWIPAQHNYNGPRFVNCKFTVPVKFTDPKISPIKNEP